jgi:hypothetical protein
MVSGDHRLLFGRDIFAENVKRGADRFAVKLPDTPDGISQGFSCNIAVRKLADNGLWNKGEGSND